MKKFCIIERYNEEDNVQIIADVDTIPEAMAIIKDIVTSLTKFIVKQHLGLDYTQSWTIDWFVHPYFAIITDPDGDVTEYYIVNENTRVNASGEEMTASDIEADIQKQKAYSEETARNFLKIFERK